MRYFIGYNLDEASAELVNKIRNEIAERFDVHEALKMPPHLTLYYPFESEAEGDLHDVLARVVSGIKSFDVRTPGFRNFGEAVWFIDVEQSDKLFDLKKKIVNVLKESLKLDENTRGLKDVHFHVTLAYKDVSSEKFKLIADYLKQQKMPTESLRIDAVTLFEFNGEKWDVNKTFNFAV